MYRIYPNKEQKIQLAKTFGCVRFVYNHYLDARMKAYEANKTTLDYYSCGEKFSVTKDLSVRTWICPNCNAELDRDVNAAINICNEGLRLLSVS